jgi:hypothetical protein
VITRSGVNSPIKVNYSCEKDIVGILGAQFLKEDGNPIGENENFVKSAYDVEVTLAHAPLKPITKIAIIPYTVDETSQLNPCSNLPSNLVKAAYINASMIGDREVLVKNVALNPIAGKSEDNPKGKSQGVCIGLNDGYYEYGLQANGSYNLKKNLETHNLILGKTPIIESIDLCSTESFDKGECDQISASGLVTLKVTAYSPDGEFDENNKFNFVNFLDLNVERPISNYSFSTYLSKYYSLLANQSGATDFLSYTSTKTSVPPIAGSTRQGQRIVTALRFKVPSSIINTPLLYMIGVKDKSGNMSATSTSPVLNSSTQHTEISKFSGSPISSIAGSAKNAFSPISTIFAKQNFSVDRATADIIFSHSSYNSRLVYKLSASTNKVSNLLEDFSQTINPSVYSYLLNGREYSDIFHLNPGPSLDRRKSRLLYLRTYNSLVEIDLENKEVPLKTIFDLNTFKIKLSDGTLKSFFLGSVGSSSPQAEIDAAMGKYLVFNIAGYVSMTSDGTAYLIARCPFVPNFVSQSNQILKLTPNSTEFIPIAGRCASNRSFNAQIDKPIATTDPIIRPLDLQLASEGLFNNSYANSLTVAEFGDKRVIYYNSHHRDGSSNTPDHPMVYKIIEDTINSSNSKIITPFGITSFPSGNGSINTYPGISIYMHLGETRLINKDLSVWKIDATDTVNFRENPITSNTFGVGGLSSEGYLLKPGSFDMETFKGDCSGDGMAYDSNCIRTLGKIVVGGPIVQAANAPHPNLYFSESLGGSLYRVRTLSDFNSERTPVVQTELGFKSREFGYSDRSVTYFSSLPSISYQKTDFGIFKKGLYFMDIDRGTLSYYPEEQDHTLSKSARIVFGSPYYFGSHNETNLLGRKMGGGTRDANTGIFDTTAGDGYNINFTTSGKPLFVYGQRIHRVDFIDNNYQMTNLQTSYLPAPIENQKLISNTTTDNISVQNLMNNYQSRISDGNFSFIEKANSLTLFINAYFYRQQKSPVMGEANYSASSFIKKLHWSDQLNPLSGKIFHVMGNPNVSGYHSQTFLPNKPALTVGLEEIKKLDMDHRFYQSSLVLAGGLFADNRPSPQSGGLANETRVYIGDYDHIRLLQNPESVNEAKLVTLCSKLPGDFKITHLTVRKQGMTNKPDELIYETQNRKIYRHVVRMNADGSFGSSDCSNDDLVGSYSWSKMSSAINNSNRMTWKENPETEDQQTLFISIVDQILEVKFKD